MSKKTLETQREKVNKALPEVKKIVKKYGLPAVNSSIVRLKEHEKKLRELEMKKAEVEELERKIR